MKKYAGLIFIILFAGILRLWQLNSLPYGVANDEISYLYSAYTVWQTGGHDVAGKFLPLSVNLDSSLSPVPVYLTAPFVGILGLSPMTGRLPFALAGIGSVMLTYFLAELLFKRKNIAIVSSFVMAFSPWHIIITRGAWDGDIAVFFYLLGIYLFIKYIEKGNILWSILPFLLGFYSYHGMKVFFVLAIPILVITYWRELLQKKKQFFLFVLLSFTILASFLYVSQTQGVTRQEALIWKDAGTMKDVVKQVNYYRQRSTAPYILREIMSNKVTILGSKILDNYFGAFSTQFLFRNGDINYIYTYGIFFKGVMYIMEFPLLFFGIIFFAKQKRKKEALLITSLLFIAPVPSAIGSGTTYIIRAMMMIPFLSLFVGGGIIYLLDISRKYKFLFTLTIFIIIAGYVISIGFFLYRYIFVFNSAGAEFWNKSGRDAAMIIYHNKKLYNHVYIAGATDKLLFQFLFFNKVDPKVFQHVWRSETNTRTIGNVSFISGCFNNGKGNPFLFLPAKTLYFVRNDCYTDVTPSMSLIDSNEPLLTLWKIYEKQ